MRLSTQICLIRPFKQPLYNQVDVTLVVTLELSRIILIQP